MCGSQALPQRRDREPGTPPACQPAHDHRQARRNAGLSVGSLPVTVTVNSPAPQVTLTDPVAGSTVSGTVALAATATTDTTQSDRPSLVTFYVDNSEVDQMLCGSSTTCAATGNWDSTGLSGQHTITARLDTNNGLHVTSPPVTVAVNSPAPQVTLTDPG